MENEFGNIQQFYADGALYAQWAADLMKSLNVGVPIVMCQQQGVKGVIESSNGFYIDPQASNVKHDGVFPSLWTEMWSGWCVRTDVARLCYIRTPRWPGVPYCDTCCCVC